MSSNPATLLLESSSLKARLEAVSFTAGQFYKQAGKPTRQTTLPEALGNANGSLLPETNGGEEPASDSSSSSEKAKKKKKKHSKKEKDGPKSKKQKVVD